MANSIEDWPPPSAITTFADGDPDENPWVSGAPPDEAIEIAAYSPEWPALFEASKELIAQALPGIALNTEHVGSTAVPNLAAKPIVDMDLIVERSDPGRDLRACVGSFRLCADHPRADLVPATGCCGMTGPGSTCTSLAATAPSTPVTSFSGIGFGPIRETARDMRV